MNSACSKRGMERFGRCAVGVAPPAKQITPLVLLKLLAQYLVFSFAVAHESHLDGPGEPLSAVPK